MDEWSRVRELAPETTIADDDLAVAERRLLARIAQETTPPRTRAATRAGATLRGLRMPTGAFAALAAVVVVALIATGAVIVAQWMPGPAPITNQNEDLDLGRPLLDQVPEGSYLRIATTTESTYVAEIPADTASGVALADGEVRIRTQSATYIPASGVPWTTANPDAPVEVIAASGPDGQLLVDDNGWYAEPSYVETAGAPAVGREWLADFPTDADGILAAFAAASGMEATSDDDAQRLWVARSMPGHPAWFLLSPAQRADALDAVRSVAGMSVTDGGGEVVVEAADPLPMSTTLDGETLLPVRGTAAAVSYSTEGGEVELPATTWTMHVSVVAGVPTSETPGATDEASARCNGIALSDAALGVSQPPADLDAAGQEALNGRDVPDFAPEEWIVVSQSPDAVVLLSIVRHPEVSAVGDDGEPTHELLTIRRTDGQWALESWYGCRLEPVLAGLGAADVVVDPTHPPAATDTELHLLVTEWACSSGRDAAERIRVVMLNELEDAVEVHLAVEPLPGAQECPGNPATPFVVPLAEPLGDRAITSWTYLDPTELRPPQ